MSRRLNVKFLAILVVVTAALGVVVHLIHERQVPRSIKAYLVRADRAEANGDVAGAAKALESYLLRRPSDFDALARLGLLLSRDLAGTAPPVLDRAAKVIDLVLIRDHERPGLRLRLAQIDIALGRDAEAKAQLERLLANAPRDAELRLMLARSLEALGDFPRAAQEYDLVRRDDPTRVEAYVQLARLLRTKLREAERADALMDAREEPAGGVVVANPTRVAAYVARGRYRREFGLKGTADDAAKAVALGPDDLDALLLAAEVAATARPDPDLKAARAHLARALALHRDDVRVYKASADVEIAARDVDAAIAKLEQGVAAIHDDLFLRWLLADLLIRTNRLDRGPRMIAELKERGLNREVIDYLNAQLLFHRGLWAEAAVALEAAAQALSVRSSLEELAKRTFTTLGECYEKLGNIDQRYLAFRRAVGITPPGGDRLAIAARTGLAASLVSLGRVDEAIEEYRKNLLLPEVTEGVRIVLARLLIFRNLRLPEGQRRWPEIESLLESSARALPNSIEVTVLRAEALAAQKQLDPARKLLEQARDQHPDQVEIWVALSFLAVRQDRPEEALPILDAAEKRLGDRLEIRLARARYWAVRGGPDASPALDRLAADTTRFSPAERIQLANGIADAHIRLGEIREAIALWTALADEQANNLQVRLVLFDAAVQTGDLASMDRVLEQIRLIEGNQGSLWRYGRARMLIQRAKGKDDPALVEARSLLNHVITHRPAWPRGPLSIAEIDDRQDNTEAALKNYQRALALGDRSPVAIRRTVQLLYQVRRYDQADQVLRRLQEEMPISTDLQRLAADISLQTRDYARALDLARRAVSGDSSDYRDHVWLGQLLWAISRRDETESRKDEAKARRAEAERALRRATELAPEKPETWVALAQYLSETNNLPAAEKAIADAEKAIPRDLAALPLALANESIGRNQRAEILYKDAVETHPDDAAAIRGLANFYVKFNRIDDAKPLLYRLIDLRAGRDHQERARDDASWARRILAIALSLEGREQVSLRALDILNTPDTPTGSAPTEGAVEDLRAKARVYALQRNRDRRREAIRLLESVSLREASIVDDRLLLAQLYEADGNWPKARDQLQAVLSEEPANPRALSSYARGLIRRKLADDARPWVASLRKAQPAAAALIELDARLAALDGKPDRAVAIIKDYVRDKDPQLLVCAGLLEDIGLYPAAEELYRRFAAQPGQPANILALAEFLGRRGKVRDALDLCDRAWATCAPEQVAISSVKVLFSSAVTDVDCRRVADRLDAAGKAAPDNVGMPFYLANVFILQGRYADAEAIFRRAFDRNKENGSPLNNLAWLLAMQDGKASEALETIDRAITISGATPEYLDTRGTIHLAMGRADLAIKELEDAVSVAPNPSNNFHLAQAYVAAKRPKDAADALQEAQNLGLKPDAMHPFERKAYEQLVAALPKKPAG